MSEMELRRNEIIERIENLQDGDSVVFEMYPSTNRFFRIFVKGTKITLIRDNETTEELLEVFENITKEFSRKIKNDEIIYILH